MNMKNIIERLKKLRGENIHRRNPDSDKNQDWHQGSFTLNTVTEKGITGTWTGFMLGVGLRSQPVILGREWLDDNWEVVAS